LLNISTQKQFNNSIRTLPKNEIIPVFGYRVFSYASIAIAHSNGMAAHTTPQPHPGGMAGLCSLQTQVPPGYLSFIVGTLENLNQNRMHWQCVDKDQRPVKGSQEIISGAIEAINPPIGVELGEGVRPTGISS
jgi:hypothetical protein